MKEYTIQDMEGNDVLITGGLGFLGSNIANRLVTLGANVTIATRSENKIRNIKGIEKQVKLIKGDITDKIFVKNCVKGKDIIFHLAGQTSHITSMENPHKDIETNCIGTMNVLEACRSVNDNAKIVFPGTTGQVGEIDKKNLPLKENIRDMPMTVYDADKLASEKYLMVYNRAYGMRTVSLRLATIYGDRQEVTSGRYGITNMFIKRAMCNEIITVYGNGSFLRDYNYVGNVVDAFLLSSQTEKTNGEYFNIGSNTSTKFIDMVKMIIKNVKEITGKEGVFKFVPWPENSKKIDVGDMVVDYSKFNEFTGWYPKVDLNEGIKKTVEFYKDRLDDYI
ncbi:MAG: SDR family NAD(P)-dependent oxidoreductase [Candidatus Aenigmarchaeota archaeon]|nr:SDR family NAD(P)-dependent oxidoreductase [Candidatus Aenigmarchaeota archaeon]